MTREELLRILCELTPEKEAAWKVAHTRVFKDQITCPHTNAEGVDGKWWVCTDCGKRLTGD